MKTINKIIFTILLCVSYTVSAMGQNLNTMPADKRDSLLISISKEAVLKFGPDYYREYKQPVISREKIDFGHEDSPVIKDCYIVTFPYDRDEETMEWDYSAKVSIWADKCQPSMVMFGNNFGRGIPEGMDWRNDTTIEPVPYQESFIILYDINNPDPNQEPLNKEYLIWRGFAKRSDGRWEKTTPDVPPHKRSAAERAREKVEREKEKEREREFVRNREREIERRRGVAN